MTTSRWNDQEAVLGDGLSDDGEIQVPFLEIARASASFSAFSTISIRSWDSDSIIS